MNFAPHAAARLAVLAGGLLAAASASMPANAEQPGPLEPQTIEDCLLEKVRAAPADVTVGQLRAQCLAPEEPSAAPVTPVVESPILDRRARESVLWTDRLALMPHRPNYLLPATWGSGFRQGDPDMQQHEVLFQYSFKLPITVPTDTGIPSFFFAYTGEAWWQAYNAEQSRPFREYNHSPEIYFELQPTYELPLGWTLRTAQFGFEHHSNGQSGEDSRSWNKLFTQLEADHGAHWWTRLRIWRRIGEDPKATPDDPRGDDNPDITRYYGHFEWRFGYRGDTWQWGLMARRSPRSDGHGAWSVDLSHPTGFNPKVRWYLSWFDGYGESLIDYNRRVKRVGLGLMLNDWF